MDMRLDLKTRTGGGTKGAKNIRTKQAEKRAVARSNARSNAFARGRNMETCIVEAEELQPSPQTMKHVSNAEKANNVLDARRLRLEKWKQDKLQKEAYLKSKQKPIFKTGVVHHSVGSPNVFGVPASLAAPLEKKVFQPRNGATTRAMRTNMLKTQVLQPAKPIAIQAIPQGNKFKAPSGVKAIAMLTIPTTPKGMSERKQRQAKPHVKCQPSKVGHSLAFPITSAQTKQNNMNRPPLMVKMNTPNVRLVTKATTVPNSGIPKNLISVSKTTPHVIKKVTVLTPGLAPIVDELPEALQDTVADSKVPTKEPQSPVLNFKHSPNVTVARGKYSDRRKPVKSRLADTCDPPIVPMPSLSVNDDDGTLSVDAPQHPAIQYRNILDKEINRLNEVCKEWTTLRSEHTTKLSENVNSLIDLAVGQTQLLIRSKFEQFRGLTFDSEKGDCVPPVMADDLQGFWEMVYIQVENVDKQFSHLNELKGNNFEEKSPTKAITKKTNPKKVSKPAARKVLNKSSGIRALIEAQRQKQLQEAGKPEKNATPKVTPRSARKISTLNQSSTRHSLLKDVLKSSSARRSEHLSPIIMRVSQFGKRVGSSPVSKTATCKDAGDSVSLQTPYKSILKDVSMIDSSMKDSRKTVNFGESTIKNLTPDTDAFESPADEPPAYSTLRIVDLHVEQSTVVGPEPCDVTPTRLPEIPAVRSTSLKRRTRGSYKICEAAETKVWNKSDIDKENYAEKTRVTAQPRQCALSFEDDTAVNCTPTLNKPRRSYRKTPYKTTNAKANKSAKVLAEDPSDSSTTEDTFCTPSSMNSWGSIKKLPYKEITNQSKSC